MKLALVVAGVVGPGLAAHVTGDTAWLGALVVPLWLGAGRILQHISAELAPELVALRAEVADELKALGR